MKIPYNILIQIKMSVWPYFKGFTLIFFFYNCRKQNHTQQESVCQSFFDFFQNISLSYNTLIRLFL